MIPGLQKSLTLDMILSSHVSCFPSIIFCSSPFKTLALLQILRIYGCFSTFSLDLLTKRDLSVHLARYGIPACRRVASFLKLVVAITYLESNIYFDCPNLLSNLSFVPQILPFISRRYFALLPIILLLPPF